MKNKEKLYNWMRTHHEEFIERMLLQCTKDETAKRMRDAFKAQGITHAAGVHLSRNQIREALKPFRRLPTAERDALLALIGQQEPYEGMPEVDDANP